MKALGVQDILANSAIRFSIGRFTTQDEIFQIIAQVQEQVKRLRELSPLSW